MYDIQLEDLIGLVVGCLVLGIRWEIMEFIQLSVYLYTYATRSRKRKLKPIFAK